ncbi:MAG TPA: DUF2330 domain-containing protein [Acidimicrobiales bacterium]|nr:DUF2330 domain-containing protein [Acidimicrobiales bacterium]
MRRLSSLAAVITGAAALVGMMAAPAGACAGLVTPGGNVRLLRTATLAAYANGLEHYVTSFEFAGGGAEFGSIVPLPAIPSKVERAGDWTLQRLERETQPQPAFARADSAGASEAKGAEVIYETRIDALDITILKGGGDSVGEWAREHGFRLTPDAPAVLDFYAARSKIFMAARFNAQAASERQQAVGDGTPIHLTIPTKSPWVPLRILGLGLEREARIDADVYLLTAKRPSLLPTPGDSLKPGFDGQASTQLLDDLRSDKGMGWIPASMWLTYLHVDQSAGRLTHDLSIDPTGRGRVSGVAAGLRAPARPRPPVSVTTSSLSTTTLAPTTTPTTAAETATSLAVLPARSDSDSSSLAAPLAIAVAAIGLVATTLVVQRRRRDTPTPTS